MDTSVDRGSEGLTLRWTDKWTTCPNSGQGNGHVTDTNVCMIYVEMVDKYRDNTDKDGNPNKPKERANTSQENRVKNNQEVSLSLIMNLMSTVY